MAGVNNNMITGPCDRCVHQPLDNLGVEVPWNDHRAALTPQRIGQIDLLAVENNDITANQGFSFAPGSAEAHDLRNIINIPLNIILFAKDFEVGDSSRGRRDRFATG